MPVTHSAEKSLRKSLKLRIRNQKLKSKLKGALKQAIANSKKENLILAQKIIDKAANNNIIHWRKAARLKSKLAKLAKSGKSQAKVSLTL